MESHLVSVEGLSTFIKFQINAINEQTNEHRERTTMNFVHALLSRVCIPINGVYFWLIAKNKKKILTKNSKAVLNGRLSCKLFEFIQRK